MSNQMLMPNKFKTIGWLILVPSAIIGLIIIGTDYDAFALNAPMFAIVNDPVFGAKQYFAITITNILPTLAGALFIIGALLVGFSKEKTEDEFIANMRLSALLWAVLANSVLMLVALLFVYGTAFFNVMVYNMFTVLIIFIVRFNYTLYKSNKAANYEK